MTNANSSAHVTKPAVDQPKTDTAAPKHADTKVDAVTPANPVRTSKP